MASSDDQAAPLHLAETAARRALLVHAFESGTDLAGDPLWSADDRAWATRLTRETESADTPPATFIDARARHALQRLEPRDPAIGKALARRGWRGAWVALAAALGLIAGFAADAIGSGQEINLLAPPFWGVIVWNLAVYALLLIGPLFAWLRSDARSIGPQLRRWLATRLSASAHGSPALLRWRAAWVRQSAPLSGARAALLLHLAAAALAAGLIGGLYLRGLVLDYRVGWQSTFLDASQVHAALALLLAPAGAVSGIAVPDVTALQALRVGPGGLSPASAAPWIHLYALTLLLAVVLPRLLLTAFSVWRSRQLSRSLPLMLPAAYVQRLLRSRRDRPATVQLLPHASTPSDAALLRLRGWIAASVGDNATLQPAPTTAYGDEDEVATRLPAPPPGTALRLAWVDLGATAEDETHGVFLRNLRDLAPAVPLLLVADETAFRARFAATPLRVAERRAHWQRFAAEQGVGFVGVDVQADDAAADREVGTAVQSALAH